MHRVFWQAESATLLIRSCGRTDFQQGDPSKLFESITKKLFLFPENTLVYPGHDYSGRTVSSIREEKNLIEGLSKISDLTNYLENKGVDNSDDASIDGYEWSRYLELDNLLLTSKLMIEGSLMRKESRGAYNRSEYPDTDNINWLKNLVYKNIDGKPIIDAIPVDLKYCAPSEFAGTIQ